METKIFRTEVKPGKILLVDGKELTVEEVIKYRFDNGRFYVKCYLSDNFIIAEDSDMKVYILVNRVDTEFKEPFPEHLEYDGKSFKFLYFAHAIAEEVFGEGRVDQDSGESFWDFIAEDNSYLSLGRNDGTNERVDFYGKTIPQEKLEMK